MIALLVGNKAHAQLTKCGEALLVRATRPRHDRDGDVHTLSVRLLPMTDRLEAPIEMHAARPFLLPSIFVVGHYPLRAVGIQLDVADFAVGLGDLVIAAFSSLTNKPSMRRATAGPQSRSRRKPIKIGITRRPKPLPAIKQGSPK
jgi:hypothetical protein